MAVRHACRTNLFVRSRGHQAHELHSGALREARQVGEAAFLASVVGAATIRPDVKRAVLLAATDPSPRPAGFVNVQVDAATGTAKHSSAHGRGATSPTATSTGAHPASSSTSSTFNSMSMIGFTARAGTEVDPMRSADRARCPTHRRARPPGPRSVSATRRHNSTTSMAAGSCPPIRTDSTHATLVVPQTVRRIQAVNATGAVRSVRSAS